MEYINDWNSIMLKNGSYYHLLKLQECGLSSALAMMRIALLRMTLVFS